LREGRYLLRTNLIEEDPAKLWGHFLLLMVIEQALKNLKAIWRSGRSFISSRRASRPTSSLPSWLIACTSRWRGACTRWHRG
jgi:hypothetical protein